MEQLRIKITKCDNKDYWYKDGIGKEVNCISINQTTKTAYIHSDDVDLIDETNEGAAGFIEDGDYEIIGAINNMKRTIHKVNLLEVDDQFITIPANSDIISVQTQGNNICIWYITSSLLSNVHRRIIMYGTGHQIDRDMNNMQFLGTVQLYGCSIVFHVFELTEL